ncbi:MAG: sugar kinase [Phenylobacterium sp.]|uniref:sugar kinase n=1 Tax=Phenylobacterium sp. TaxID=1871053 RepID=UPI0027210C32|nr:sugar kinase [Phenylobacterium sp.]MDO9431540.1 sugar kinase [Phenylobacterium sp.]
MVDLSSEMAELWTSLGAPAAGRGRVVQITAARRGEGASTVARELALYVARRAGRSVWLVDLDLMAAPQHAALTEAGARYGTLSDPVQASPDGSMFFTVQPEAQTAAGEVWPDARYLAAHRIGSARWWVTRFQRERLAPGQGVHVLPTSRYWDSLRSVVDLVIVDGPSPERSRAALTVAPFMDQTVLVVAADQPDVSAPARLRDEIADAGGDVAGLFFNRGPLLKAVRA